MIDKRFVLEIGKLVNVYSLSLLGGFPIDNITTYPCYTPSKLSRPLFQKPRKRISSDFNETLNEHKTQSASWSNILVSDNV